MTATDELPNCIELRKAVPGVLLDSKDTLTTFALYRTTCSISKTERDSLALVHGLKAARKALQYFLELFRASMTKHFSIYS